MGLRGAMFLAAALALAAAGHGEMLLQIDFEQGPELQAYPALILEGGVTGEIVPGGPDGHGHCLKIANQQPGRYCTATIRLNFPMRKNLTLTCDHKESIEADKQALYFGILFFGPNEAQWFGSDRFSEEWRHVEISPAELTSPTGTTLTLETLLTRLNLYGRAANETPARMTVWLDNIRVHTEPRAAGLSGRERISYTAAPFFHWPRNYGRVRLEYAREPSFPPAATTTIETERNWYVPSRLLEPGDWYWRLYRDSELLSGYTPIEKIVIPREAHRYLAPPIDFRAVAQKPYPRLITATRVTEAKQREALSERAKALFAQGVPDDPPPYAPGNPEWPTWIEWYGKVHGGITSATGTRLQQMAELYVQTRDPQVRDWLKAMALKAASWDPEKGGSSIRGGDIGFQHLLRGLNWAYDALHEDLTAQERETLRGMIIRRAEIFWDYLNPFRFGREYNNHAWLCTLALGESGLLLCGEYPRAEDWAQYAYDLYRGLYLCGLGYQGDNNEGIAYWGYGLGFVMAYADMMRHVCGVDLYQHPWLAQTVLFPLYTCPPGAWAVSFADTGMPNHGVFGPTCTRLVKELAIRTRQPYALWYAGGTATEAGFAPQPPFELPQSIHYRFIGWGIFNTSLINGAEGVTVAMHSGKFWAGHQHEDQNAFVIHAYGEKLAIDSGYYDWYGSEHFTKYSTLTRAHNAILVDGEDQHSRREGCDGKIKCWFDSPACGYMIGEVAGPEMYRGKLKQWERRILFVKPGYVLLHDLLEAAAGPARYDWLLHTVAPIETKADRQSFGLTSGRASLRGRFLAPADLTFNVVKGFPVEPVDGYSTRPVPPERYVQEWTLWATPRMPRQKEEFVAALQISRAQEQPAELESLPTTNGWGMRLRGVEEEIIALFQRQGQKGPMMAQGLTGEGEAALLSRGPKGELLRAAMLNGTAWRFSDWRMEANKPCQVAWIRNELGDFLIFQTEAEIQLRVRLPSTGTFDREKAKGIVIRAQRDVWEFEAPAGHYELIWRRESQPLRQPAGIIRLRHYALPVGTYATHYYWGVWEVAKPTRYAMGLQPQEGVSLQIDGQPVELGEMARVWLKPGTHTLLIAGAKRYPELRLTPLSLETATAEMLAKDYKPAAGALIFEAEKPTREGRITGRIVEKVGASGGLAHCVWDTDGQWASWRFVIPRAGDYRLLIRACGEQENVWRALSVDGAERLVRFGATGGWARTQDDWRYFVAWPRLRLPAGEHELRLERLDGSQNLDCFVWEPLGESRR